MTKQRIEHSTKVTVNWEIGQDWSVLREERAKRMDRKGRNGVGMGTGENQRPFTLSTRTNPILTGRSQSKAHTLRANKGSPDRSKEN